MPNPVASFTPFLCNMLPTSLLSGAPANNYVGISENDESRLLARIAYDESQPLKDR